MIWQDLLIAIANVIFSVSLVPQVYYGFKKKKGMITIATSMPTFIALYWIVVAFYTLELYLASVLSFVSGSLWFVLFLQRVVYKKV